MIALILWLLMPHPVVYGNPVRDYNPDTDKCLGKEGWEWRVCQPRVINLGPWDVRPAPKDWPENKALDEPKSWPEYDTEKR